MGFAHWVFEVHLENRYIWDIRRDESKVWGDLGSLLRTGLILYFIRSLSRDAA